MLFFVVRRQTSNMNSGMLCASPYFLFHKRSTRSITAYVASGPHQFAHGWFLRQEKLFHSITGEFAAEFARSIPSTSGADVQPVMNRHFL